jgi:hypothetical protein
MCFTPATNIEPIRSIAASSSDSSRATRLAKHHLQFERRTRFANAEGDVTVGIAWDVKAERRFENVFVPVIE